MTQPVKIKKILIYISTLEGGGAEKRLILLANYFVQNEIQVTILSSIQTAYHELVDDRVILKLTYNKWPHRGKTANRIRRSVTTPPILIHELKRNPPDVLISTVLEANLMAGSILRIIGLKTPFVISQASLIRDEYHPRKLSHFLKRAMDKAMGILTLSPAMTDTVYDFYPELKTPVRCIPCPIVLNYPPKTKTPDLTSGRALRLLNVGRLAEVKGQMYLLKALARLDIPYHLDILGLGPLEEALKLLAAELGITENVTFHGFVHEPQEFYYQADVMVATSLHEGFSNAILESISYGLPVISFDCQGGPFYILDRPEIGTLVPLKDEISLADAITEAYQKFPYDIKACRQRAEDFSVEKVGAEYLATLQEFLALRV